MPTFVEFDKLTGKIKRLLSSEERPPDAGSLSYQILPPGMGDVDLSSSIEDVRTAVAEHFGQDLDLFLGGRRLLPALDLAEV